MKKTIEILKEMRETHKRDFIKNSLIKRSALLDSPVPDTDFDLGMIYELNKAISILENSMASMVNSSKAN